MGLHAPWSRFMPTLNGNVMTSGGSLNLAKGQLGIFDIKDKTKDGLVAVDDFSSAGANDLFQLRLGNNEIGVTRGLSNKNKESRAFRLSEVKGLDVFVPNQVKKTDKFLIGYDGINESKALTFNVNEPEILSIKLEGGIIEVLGYEYGCTTLNLHFEKESADQTNQEVVEKAVEALRRDVLKEMIPVTDAINVSVINSESPSTPADPIAHTFYNLSVQDAGDSNALAEVQAQFGTKVERTDRDGQTSVYTLLLPTIDASGVPADFSPETGTDISWTAGEECNAISEEYIIQLADEDAEGDRLTELEEAFPDLTIVVKEVESANVAGGCQTVYSTTITSNIVCEDCDPILRNTFETEAPKRFGFTDWEKGSKTYSETALMGIKIEGKETVNVPGELIRDSVPFIDTSVRVSVAGGFRSSVFSSFVEGSGDRFAVKVLQRAEDLENLGGDLWGLEDRDFTYFQGYSRHRNVDGHQNEYIKLSLGEETVLKGRSQYIVYTLKVQPKSFSQGFAGQLEEAFNYTIAVETGKQAGVEALLNAVATAAGIPTVSAS
jgi:hypothetical protein